ncbi:lectin alpha chain [Cajanus cajan]|uniref:lectin alpha chain n=1 Tax=Cajanus cajan TaxID=3821 RepID=UPI0010FB4BEB|nr:lectin alpha chain [Cajanus cajan]
MAISNKSIISVIGLVAMLLMAVNRVNSADSLSFSFNSFGLDQKDLIFQGDATALRNALQLTRLDSQLQPLPSSVGRVLYSAPIQLVGAFETSFTFSISSPDTIPGDGLTFFIASHDTVIPPNSNGKFLGLFPGTNTARTNSSNINDNNNHDIHVDNLKASDRVVAVEFDTYPNLDIRDPNFVHIGINVNSITSARTAQWVWRNGLTATARINYNSLTKTLTAATFYPGTGTEVVSISHAIDLSTVLPQWVRVGFSASTGQHKQKNSIHSWAFSTILKNSKIEEEEDTNIVSVV